MEAGNRLSARLCKSQYFLFFTMHARKWPLSEGARPVCLHWKKPFRFHTHAHTRARTHLVACSELSGSTRAAGAVLAGRADVAGARNVPPVLELLVNLSCADPHAIAGWLTAGFAGWSPGSALAGLESELNNRDEKVRE